MPPQIYLLIIFIIASCKAGKDKTGRIYMPDMYASQAYETYSTNPNFKDGMSARTPVNGTVPRGNFLPYDIVNSAEGYELSKKTINPYANDTTVALEGKRLYEINCAICHGKTGKSEGFIVENGKFPPPPSYFTDALLNMPDGQMYYSVHYGKNLMGSYANQLDSDERWKIIHYIKDLQKEFVIKNPSKPKTIKSLTDTLKTI